MKKRTFSLETGPWRGIGPGRDLFHPYFNLGWFRVEVTNDWVSDLLNENEMAVRLRRYRAALDALLHRMRGGK